MNPDVLRDLQSRVDAIERTMVRFRAGEVTGTSPLDVALGGSDVPYEDVRSVAGLLQSGDQVAALLFSNDMLVLGRIQGGAEGASVGSSSATWTASKDSATVVIPHGLGVTPRYAAGSPKSADVGYRVTAVDATNISVQGWTTAGGSFSGTLNFYWLAIA